MGTVVKLDSSTRGRSQGGPSRRRESRTALVLGGGGFTGGVYEIGALRALDLLSVNRSVNQFDVYVGTSAGALIAVAGRQRRHARADDAGRQRPDADAVPRHQPRDAPAAELPRVRAARASSCRCSSPALARVRRPQPAGVLAGRPRDRARRGAALRHLHRRGDRALRPRRVLADPDRTDDFRLLETELYLAATDLDTCERIVLGAEGWDDVPISRAVAASAALPMVYKPVEVKGRELVDGGIVSTTNLDIAVEAGAEFIVVVNPLVPVRQRLLQGDPDAVRHARPPRVGHGLPEDRLPDVQAARLPAPARDGARAGRSATRASTSC